MQYSGAHGIGAAHAHANARHVRTSLRTAKTGHKNVLDAIRTGETAKRPLFQFCAAQFGVAALSRRAQS
jgi:hypothetical protein